MDIRLEPRTAAHPKREEIERLHETMKKRELCSFGKKINHRLIALEQSKVWLIEEVKRHTGLYFDRSYLRKIETGQLATPKIVDAICEILGIAVQGDYTKRKDQ